MEACGRNLVGAKSTSSGTINMAGTDETDSSLAAELQFLGTLGLKCKGYSQSVDLIQRRVNVVIGLVRINATASVKKH